MVHSKTGVSVLCQLQRHLQGDCKQKLWWDLNNLNNLKSTKWGISSLFCLLSWEIHCKLSWAILENLSLLVWLRISPFPEHFDIYWSHLEQFELLHCIPEEISYIFLFLKSLFRPPVTKLSHFEVWRGNLYFYVLSCRSAHFLHINHHI